MRSQATKNLIKEKRNLDIELKKDKGLYIGRTVPYGYKLNNRKLEIDKETSHIVYLIYNLYDKGYTNTQIANYLNERYILNPSSYNIYNQYILFYNQDYNKEWQRGTIKKVLKNKVYNGYYRYSNEKTHETIIDDKLFNRVQDRMKEKLNKVGYDMFYQNKNIFSCKVYCSECGKPFTLGYSKCKDGIKKYLRCGSYDTRRQNKIDCCNKLAISYDELLDILSIYIEDNIFNSLDINSLKELYNEKLKDNSINDLRNYLKQEKTILLEKLNNKNENMEINDLCNVVLIKNNKDNEKIYKQRLDEIEEILKNIYSFARTKEVKNSDLYIDKNIIDYYVEKIEIGSYKDNNRNIKIELK